MVPTGFRFNPTDEELIEILHQKVSGDVAAMASFDFIAERNIYDLEPQDLHWTESMGLNKNERYYYCKRKSDSREVMGRGWWKATSHVKTIFGNGNGGQVTGYKRPLTFHKFKDNQKSRKDGIKTDWIMHEYGLQSISTEWRLCKIKYKGKEKLKEDMGIMSMENFRNKNTTPPMSFEAGHGSGTSSMNVVNPTQLELALEEKEQQQLPQSPLMQPSPVNNDFWSNSNMMFNDDQQLQQELLAQPYPSSSSLPILHPSYDHDFAAQLDTQSEQPFPDLWSWANWH